MTYLPLCNGKQMSQQVLMFNGLDIVTNDRNVSFCWVCGFFSFAHISVKDKDCSFRYSQACYLENMQVGI